MSDRAKTRLVGRDLAEVVRRMVEEPDAVEVEDFVDDEGIFFELAVAEDDLGKVIGRQGRTARALRTLLEVRGERDGQPYDLEIVEEDD